MSFWIQATEQPTRFIMSSHRGIHTNGGNAANRTRRIAIVPTFKHQQNQHGGGADKSSGDRAVQNGNLPQRNSGAGQRAKESTSQRRRIFFPRKKFICIDGLVIQRMQQNRPLTDEEIWNEVPLPGMVMV